MADMEKLLAALRNSPAGTYARQAQNWVSPRYRVLRTRYYKLEKREHRLLQLAALILAVLAGYNLIYLPILSYQSGLEDEIVARQRDLAEVRQMVVTYRRLKTELASLEKNTAPPAKDFSLTSILTTALNGAVEAEKIGGISGEPDKPISDQFTQYSVLLKLNGVSLPQLVDVLYQIKSLKVPVVVSNLSIRKHNPDPHSYDVDMTCSVLGKNA
jgi:type II secretory pathway component PulM